MGVVADRTRGSAVVVLGLRAWCRVLPISLFVDLRSTGIFRVGGIASCNFGPYSNVHEIKQRTHIGKTGRHNSNSGLNTCPHARWDLVICFVSVFSLLAR